MVVNNEQIEVKNNNLNVSYEDLNYFEKVDARKLGDLITVDLNAEDSKLLRIFLYDRKRTFYIEGQKLTTTDYVRHK